MFQHWAQSETLSFRRANASVDEINSDQCQIRLPDWYKKAQIPHPGIPYLFHIHYKM